MVGFQPISLTSLNTYNRSELLQNIKSQDKSNIPTCFEEITPEWIEMIVNQFRVQNDLEPYTDAIKSFEGISCKHNAGQLSSVFRLLVQISESSYQFVAKFLPSDDRSIVEACNKNVFEKEISIYFDLLPAIKCGVSESLGDLIPDVIYASHNLNGAGVIVFKSCEMDGFSGVQESMGLRPSHLRIALQSLARFHAYAWKFIDDSTLEAVKDRYDFLNEKQTPKRHFSIGLSPHENLERQFNKVLSKLTPFPHNNKFLTIVHGEYWEPNLMFKDSSSPQAELLQILDWKHARLDSGVYDLAFLLGSQDLRGDEIRDYIELYGESFSQTCRELGIVPLFSMEELREEYEDILRDSVSPALAHVLRKELMFLKANGKDPKRVKDFENRVEVILPRFLSP